MKEKELLMLLSLLISFFLWGKFFKCLIDNSCALPVTSQYIVMRGGFVDKHWAVLSTSGLIYLGIGDTAVTEYSKSYY